MFSQQGVADNVDEALVGGHDAGEADHQIITPLDVMRTSRQEWIGNDHAQVCDA